jgi:hypothetical protein
MIRQVGLGRCFEFTVTPPDNCVMGWQFQERWHSLYTNVLRKLFESGCGARERQKRGAIHMHSVVEMPFECEPFPWNEVRNGCYKHVDRRLLLLWRYLRRVLPKYGFGRFRLVPIWSNGRATARYFAKYVTKTFERRDERDGCSRRWCTWGSARRAKCSFAFVRSQACFKISWMASVLGFEAYEDFKENLGPRWAYYLFPVLKGERWNNCFVAVCLIARLLREGFLKEAGWVSRSIESGANVDCSELTVLQPWLSEYVDCVSGVTLKPS